MHRDREHLHALWRPRRAVRKTVATPAANPALSGTDRKRRSAWLRSPHRLGCVARLVAAVAFLVISQTIAWAAIPEGVWRIDAKAAVQLFDCDGLLCGRIFWLKIPRDRQGELDRDKHNPDPVLRPRRLCGLTILWGLHPTDPGRWGGGWFYNPDDGRTYNITAQLKSADVLIARIYLGIPFLGKTKTLLRVPHGTSEGWC